MKIKRLRRWGKQFLYTPTVNVDSAVISTVGGLILFGSTGWKFEGVRKLL